MGAGRAHLAGLRRTGQVFTAAIVGVIGIFTVEPTAHHDDAAQYWVMAGRLARTGEPFYVAAVDHKGPLWVGAYRLAWAVSGEQAWFWFLMSMQVVVLAGATAAAVRWLLHMMDVPRPISSTAAVLLGLYLVFGPEGYSNLLYGRNITTALTTVGVAFAWRSVDAKTERPERAALSGGIALGLATQTVFTTAIPALVITVALARLAHQRRRRLLGAWILGLMAALGSIVVWYGAKGATSELRTWLWDYNLAYGSSDAPMLERSGRAAQEIAVHLLTRPFLLIAPGALLVVSTMQNRWRRPVAFVGCWWLGELASIAAPDRWFGHYWILLAAPTVCLGGLAAAAVSTDDSAIRSLRRPAIGALAGLAAIYAIPGIAVGTAAAAGFSGVDRHQLERENTQPSEVAELRSLVDMHSDRDDPIFVWASAAGPYVAFDRPAAARFDRRTWLTGEIYGSERLAVVPDAWADLIDDLAVSEPRLIVEYLRVPIDAGSPLGQLVTEHYVVVAETELARLHARLD